MALTQQSQRDLLHTYLERSAAKSLRWSLAMFPTNAYAQDAEMSLSDFEDFVYRACFLDDEDPVARWQELSQKQERLVKRLEGKHTIHLHGRDTHLTFPLDRRMFLNHDVYHHLPVGR